MPKQFSPDEIARGVKLAAGMRYSYKSIALATGYSERRVKRDVSAGLLDPRDLTALSRYIQEAKP